MVAWYNGLSVWEQVYFWIGVVSTVFLLVQIVLLCFSAFGGDVDLDGDGILDGDPDPGVSLFTVKGLTAFFVIGGWAGLLVCTLVSDSLAWLSVIVAFVAGLLAMIAVAFIIRAIMKLQCSGNLVPEKLVGQTATVYVSVPAERTGRGKITMEAQGRFTEFDAVTDEREKLPVDTAVEIVAVENECMVIARCEKTASAEDAAETAE